MQVNRKLRCPCCNSARVEKVGEASDGRPQLMCRQCDHVYTLHIQGEIFSREDGVLYFIDIVSEE